MNPTAGAPPFAHDPTVATDEPWRRFRTATAALAFVALTVTAGACSSTPTPTATAPAPTPATGVASSVAAPVGTKVIIKDFAFAPKRVTIKAGQTVEFTNEDTAPHEPAEGTPGKQGPLFDVPFAGGESGATSPLPAGTYPYYCALHEHMKGEIVVE